jgi:hypothetical protein
MPFAPGQSGNPSGRPKEAAAVKALARQFTTEAIEKLVELMRGDDKKLARAAAVDILDRAIGKPTQMIGSDDDSPLKACLEVRFVGTDPVP